MEFEFSFCVYPLTPEEINFVTERLQVAILKEVEVMGKFMGPVNGEEVKENVEKSVD
jgi:hypothetical protein